MPSFKEVVNSKKDAFGVRIAGANRKLQMKSLQENIMKAKCKVKELMFDKYYLVPKDYTMVQWKAFVLGMGEGRGLFSGFIGSPLWWTIIAATNYVQCIGNAIAGKYRSFPWIAGSMDIVLGAGILAIASYFRVKKMRREEQEKQRSIL